VAIVVYCASVSTQIITSVAASFTDPTTRPPHPTRGYRPRAWCTSLRYRPRPRAGAGVGVVLVRRTHVAPRPSSPGWADLRIRRARPPVDPVGVEHGVDLPWLTGTGKSGVRELDDIVVIRRRCAAGTFAPASSGGVAVRPSLARRVPPCPQTTAHRRSELVRIHRAVRKLRGGDHFLEYRVRIPGPRERRAFGLLSLPRLTARLQFPSSAQTETRPDLSRQELSRFYGRRHLRGPIGFPWSEAKDYTSMSPEFR